MCSSEVGWEDVIRNVSTVIARCRSFLINIVQADRDDGEYVHRGLFVGRWQLPDTPGVLVLPMANVSFSYTQYPLCETIIDLDPLAAMFGAVPRGRKNNHPSHMASAVLYCAYPRPIFILRSPLHSFDRSTTREQIPANHSLTSRAQWGACWSGALPPASMCRANTAHLREKTPTSPHWPLSIKSYVLKIWRIQYSKIGVITELQRSLLPFSGCAAHSSPHLVSSDTNVFHG